MAVGTRLAAGQILQDVVDLGYLLWADDPRGGVRLVFLVGETRRFRIGSTLGNGVDGRALDMPLRDRVGVDRNKKRRLRVAPDLHTLLQRNEHIRAARKHDLIAALRFKLRG